MARHAGVSSATVSRVLSRPEMVTEATRTAVMEAVAATGYRVNLAARNLRKQRTGAIVALVPNLGNPFFARILAGMGQELSAEGIRGLGPIVERIAEAEGLDGHKNAVTLRLNALAAAPQPTAQQKDLS